MLCCLTFFIAPSWCAGQQKDTLTKENNLKTATDTGKKTQDQVTVMTRVSGQVTDAASGQPLPDISIGFTGSSYGTRTDSQGKFSLGASGSFSHISFSYVGYLPVTRPIKPGQANMLAIKLVSGHTQLKEVKVNASKRQRYRNKGNPAVELIQQVIDHKDQNRMQSADYLQYEQYERVGFSLFNISRKLINSRLFSKYKFMLDSTQVINGETQTTMPVFFSEKLYQYYYRKNPQKTIRVLQAQKTMNIIKFIDTAGVDIYLKRLYGNNIDLYTNNIFILSNQFLSPIADHAPNFYKFFITDTIQTANGKVVELNFTPRTKGDLLFEGKLQVTLDGHYAVAYCDLQVNKQININFIRSLDVRQNFEKYPDGRYYLSKSNVSADFGVLKNKGTAVYGDRTVLYQHYQLNSPKLPVFYEGKSEQIAANSIQTDTGFWAQHRADSLPASQARGYAMINKLEGMRSFKRASWIASTITGGYGDLGPVQLGPIDAIYSFNDLEGSRFRMGGRTTPKFNKSVYLEGYAAYGTSDKQLKYDAAAYYSLNQTPFYRYPNDYFKINYQYDIGVPGRNPSFDNAQNALTSFHRGKSDYWLYNRTFSLAYVKDFENHLSYNLAFKNWTQQAAGTLVYELNDQDNTVVHDLTTSEIDLGLRYAPHEQILQGTMHRRTIHSKYPIFNVQFSQAFKGMLNGSYNYTRINASIYKRFYLSQLGYTDITLQGNLLAGKVPFPLLNISPANQSIAYDANAYNMMDYLEFVSDHYAGLNLTHGFDGFFLNKIPLISHLKWREFISFKVLYGGLRNENNPLYTKNLYRFPIGADGANGTYALGNTPYVEAGAGIGNIFKVLRIDAIRRFNYLDHPGVSAYGIKLSFSPDF